MSLRYIWQIVEKLSSTHLRLILKQARHAKFVQPIACRPRQFWPTLLVHHAPWRSKYFFLITLFWKDVQDDIKWKRTLVQKKYVDCIFLPLFCMSSLFYLQTLKCFQFVEALLLGRCYEIWEYQIADRLVLSRFGKRGGRRGRGGRIRRLVRGVFAGEGLSAKINFRNLLLEHSARISQSACFLSPHDISREAIMKLQSPNYILLGTIMFQL